MRKVVLYTLMSADGAVEDPTRYFPDFDFSGFDEDMSAHEARVIGAQDTVLLGRKTYDQWSRYWPSSDAQPFADFINNVQKRVLTSSTPTTTWTNTTVANGPLADLVAELKATPGGDIGVHGSIDLARSMLRARLVDQLSLVIAPTLSGIGRRLFDPDLFDDTEVRRLELLQATGTSSGGVLLDYRIVP
ncbi:MAG: dihydrofolate reductase [Micromonosporaceae bacterium]|nr:dihydrofolate reductase [Micromonosporaceae bacterium]